MFDEIDNQVGDGDVARSYTMANHPNRSKRSYSAARNPTPEEIRALRNSADLTQTEAAELIYCTLRGWQDWEGGARRMHPAFWELFRIKLERTGAQVEESRRG